jgi:hypothetical protein
MKARTTGVLLLITAALAAFIAGVERRAPDRASRRAAARTAFRISPEAVRSLRIETTGGVVRCVFEGGQWMMEEPVRAPADSGAVQRILYGLETLPRGEVISAKDRSERGQGLADYGFEPAQASVLVEGDGLNLAFEIGRATALGRLFVRETRRTAVISTSADLLSLLPVSASDLRDRSLFRIDPSIVRRIQVRRPEGFLQLVRSEAGEWTLQQPFVARADAAAVDAWLDDLVRIRAEAFVRDGAPDFTPYGFEDPGAAEISFDLDHAETPTAALLIGAAPEASPDLRYARRRSGDTVVTIPAQYLARLRIPVADLRDRRLLPLDPARTQAIVIERGGQSLTLARTNGVWSVAAPSAAPAESAAVDQFLREWTTTRVEAFSALGTNDYAAAGLSPPYARIVFHRNWPPVESSDAPAGGVRELRVGNVPQTNGWFAATFAGEPPALIRPPLPSLLSPNPLLYRSRTVFPVAPEEVRALILVREGREQRIERDAQGVWSLPAGASGMIDPDDIRRRVANLQTLRAAALTAENPESIAEYGLDAPVASFTVVLRGEQGISKTLLIGRSTAEGAYAMIRGHGLVFLLDVQNAEELQRSLYQTPPPAAAAPPAGPPAAAATAGP